MPPRIPARSLPGYSFGPMQPYLVCDDLRLLLRV